MGTFYENNTFIAEIPEDRVELTSRNYVEFKVCGTKKWELSGVLGLFSSFLLVPFARLYMQLGRIEFTESGYFEIGPMVSPYVALWSAHAWHPNAKTGHIGFLTKMGRRMCTKVSAQK